MSINLYSGILLHPTSLPGSYGIGEIGFEAYKFVDDLADMGQSLWQILPLNPTDIYNSPYSSLSTFAGNHLLISLDLLVEDNLLDRKLIPEINNLDPNIVDFDEVISVKTELLAIVAENFHEKISSTKKDEYHEFCVLNEFWLSDFSRYWSIKRQKIDLDKNFLKKIQED